MKRTTTAVLLAAGAGTRLGMGPKALLPFRGGTLLAHAARQLLEGGCAEVIVVVGAGAAKVRATPLPPACRFVENQHWSAGMGSSFTTGVAAAGGGPVLVALVDQPGMTSELVARLLLRHQTGRITAAGYRFTGGVHGLGDNGGGSLRRGNPVLFPPGLAPEAAASAKGDSGAREYLAVHGNLVDVVDCTDLSDGADLDTPVDLHLLEDQVE